MGRQTNFPQRTLDPSQENAQVVNEVNPNDIEKGIKNKKVKDEENLRSAFKKSTASWNEKCTELCTSCNGMICGGDCCAGTNNCREDKCKYKNTIKVKGCNEFKHSKIVCMIEEDTELVENEKNDNETNSTNSSDSQYNEDEEEPEFENEDTGAQKQAQQFQMGMMQGYQLGQMKMRMPMYFNAMGNNMRAMNSFLFC